MTTIDEDIQYTELVKDYRRFTHDVTQCYAYLLAGDIKQAYALIALTAGQAMGIANRIGLSIDGSKRKAPNIQNKPWEEIGISRSTYYRDQRRSKLNNG